MAGWILYNKGLDKRPQIVRTMSACAVDKWRAVGAWLTLWEWADDVTEDGFVPYVTPKDVDEMVGVPGFFTVGVEVGWLAHVTGGIQLVHFTEYNTESAKKRAKDAKRKARVRNVSANPRTKRGQMSECPRTNRGATEHNRTEQNIISSSRGARTPSSGKPETAAAAEIQASEEAKARRQKAEAMVMKRPWWLPEEREWLGDSEAGEIVTLLWSLPEIDGKPQGPNVWKEIIVSAEKGKMLKNPAGFVLATVRKRAKKLGGAA